MIITDVKIEAYQLALKSAWVTSSGLHAQRQGFIITLSTDSQHTGQGDCCPIHGTENLQQAYKYLKTLSNQLIHKSVDKLLCTHWPVVQNPACCFALETALLDLQSKQLNTTVAQILNPDTASEIKVNTMIGHLDDSVTERALTAEQQGYRVLKIKMGVNPLASELEFLTQLLNKLKPQTCLRLDANQAWTEGQAHKFINGLSDFADRIDSLEEPLKSADFKVLQQLQQSTTIELALDESLPIFLQQHSVDQSPVKRFIIKPARIGSLRASFTLVRQADKNGITSVITSGLESNTGLNACIQLAAAVNNQQYHGLATSSWFASNIGSAPEILSGRIVL